jgi:L-threonylcarbamoyladenylate synthase
MADLNGRIAGCVDGGPTGVGVESTVVDCSYYTDDTSTPARVNGALLSESDPPLVILRPGGVTKADLEQIVGVGRVVTDAGLWAAKPAIPPSSALTNGNHNVSPTTNGAEQSQQQQQASVGAVATGSPTNEIVGPRAPGMKYTHYAPRAPVWIVDGTNIFFQSQIDQARARGEKVGVLATEHRASQLRADVVLACGLHTDLNTVARKLYDCLRAFDDTDVAIIFSEQFAAPDDKGMGEAVMNRLDKAAGHRLLREASPATSAPSSVVSQ